MRQRRFESADDAVLDEKRGIHDAPPIGMQRDSYYRIVVALDLSEYAEIVLEHALDQAARHSAVDVHFLTVVANDHDQTVEDAKAKLARLVLEGLETVARPEGWRARLHVRAGRAHEEIVSLAGEIDAHLVVVGRFGVRGALRQLGSTTHRVMEHAHCPVLAVNLVDHPFETQPQCPDCVRVRADSEGERWFCDAHSAPDRTLATTILPPSTQWSGGGLLW